MVAIPGAGAIPIPPASLMDHQLYSLFSRKRLPSTWVCGRYDEAQHSNGKDPRALSGCACDSTLITSAPISAKNWEIQGPATTTDMSSTVMPARGPTDCGRITPTRIKYRRKPAMAATAPVKIPNTTISGGRMKSMKTAAVKKTANDTKR